jgi:DNA-binding transcriptional ArsR family regulator
MASLAHPTRMTILRELAKDSMGPAEFQQRHPSHSLPFVRGHFRALERHGYIERCPRPRGRGSYFRPVKKSVFSRARLEELGEPSSHFTTALCLNYAERIAEAFERETFSARADSRFIWTALSLDEDNWKAGVKATNALFWYFLEVRRQATDRISQGESVAIPATTGFCCIASPPDSEALPIIPPMTYDVTRGAYNTGGLTVNDNMARALAHPLRVRILHRLTIRASSPAQIAVAYPDASLQMIWKHCLRLEELGCIQRIKRRSGVLDHNLFSLMPGSLFSAATYGALPMSIRSDVDSVLVESYINRIADSIVSGTIRARLDSHLTWTGLHLDQRAWLDLVMAIDAVFQFVLLLQQRTNSNDETQLIPVTLGYSCFESPPDSKIATFDPDEENAIYADETKAGRERQTLWVRSLTSKLAMRGMG